MPAKSLSDLSDKMREIDIAMLMTRTDGGAIAGRPMSNNGDVEYDGDSYYFTMSDARMVADIEADPTVSLAFQAEFGDRQMPRVTLEFGRREIGHGGCHKGASPLAPGNPVCLVACPK